MQIPTTTPTPKPVEIIQQATEALDTWNSLGPVMGLLLVVGLAVIAILIIAYFNRDSNSTAIKVLVDNIKSKDREIDALEKGRDADREAHRESLSAIHDQMIRSNDILEATKRQNDVRDTRQNEMLANQARIATAFETLLTQGSVPLQKVATDVAMIVASVNRIDTRTSNWQPIIDMIPGIKEEFNKRMDDLANELKRRKTQPLPPVDVPPAGEGSAL